MTANHSGAQASKADRHIEGIAMAIIGNDAGEQGTTCHMDYIFAGLVLLTQTRIDVWLEPGVWQDWNGQHVKGVGVGAIAHCFVRRRPPRAATIGVTHAIICL